MGSNSDADAEILETLFVVDFSYLQSPADLFSVETSGMGPMGLRSF